MCRLPTYRLFSFRALHAFLADQHPRGEHGRDGGDQGREEGERGKGRARGVKSGEPRGNDSDPSQYAPPRLAVPAERPLVHRVQSTELPRGDGEDQRRHLHGRGSRRCVRKEPAHRRGVSSSGMPRKPTHEDASELEDGQESRDGEAGRAHRSREGRGMAPVPRQLDEDGHHGRLKVAWAVDVLEKVEGCVGSERGRRGWLRHGEDDGGDEEGRDEPDGLVVEDDGWAEAEGWVRAVGHDRARAGLPLPAFACPLHWKEAIEFKSFSHTQEHKDRWHSDDRHRRRLRGGRMLNEEFSIGVETPVAALP